MTEEEIAQKEKELAAKEKEIAEREAKLLSVKDDKLSEADVAKLVEEEVAKRVADAKVKIDGAYKQRDEALAKLSAAELAEKESRVKLLEEEGKFKEALELKLATEQEEKAKLKADKDALEKRNVELTRDIDVRSALASFALRNDKAADVAKGMITENLVLDDKGVWTHKSGQSISAAVKAFAEDEANSFLFKPPENSGGGGGPITPNTDLKNKGSLFGMSQAEVIQLAIEGKLPNQ